MKMERFMKDIIRFMTLILILTIPAGCDNGEDIINPGNNGHSDNYGRIQLDFPLDDVHVPLRCIKRADLSIAYTADSIYREEYITVANVSDYQKLYEFILEPGVYYYKAGKVCTCGRDTCLWGGYPGGQNGMLWTMSSFEIISGEISYDRLKFDK
jgi:hypothetical protein